MDLLVEGCLLVEAKAVEIILPIHKAQLLSYMKLLDVAVGLLINFHEMKVTERSVGSFFQERTSEENEGNLTGGNGDNGERKCPLPSVISVASCSILTLNG